MSIYCPLNKQVLRRLLELAYGLALMVLVSEEREWSPVRTIRAGPYTP